AVRGAVKDVVGRGLDAPKGIAHRYYQALVVVGVGQAGETAQDIRGSPQRIIFVCHTAAVGVGDDSGVSLFVVGVIDCLLHRRIESVSDRVERAALAIPV